MQEKNGTERQRRQEETWKKRKEERRERERGHCAQKEETKKFTIGRLKKQWLDV